MKKLMVLLCAALCLMFTGCDSAYAKNEYNSDKKISASTDKYDSTGWDLKNNFGDMTITASAFSGRQTIWSSKYDNSEKSTATAEISLSAGKAKVVFIDDSGAVKTVAELEYSDSQKEVSKSIDVVYTKGTNRYKLVGYDCKDVKISLSI